MLSKKSYTVDEALKRMEHYCSYQERCHKEVIQKLRSMSMIPEAIDHIVVKLIHDNFLNEERYLITTTSKRFMHLRRRKQKVSKKPMFLRKGKN